MRDTTLSDGTSLPKGTLVAAVHATHLNEANYANAGSFDPFRFAKMREREGEELKHQFVNTSLDYVPFGHGRHAWCVPSFKFPLANTETEIGFDPAMQPRTVLRCERAEGATCVYRAELRLEARWRRKAACEPFPWCSRHSFPDRPGAVQKAPDCISLIVPVVCTIPVA